MFIMRRVLWMFSSVYIIICDDFVSENSSSTTSNRRPPPPPQIVNRAIEYDKANKLEDAFSAYSDALTYFGTAVKYEKNPKVKEMLNNKIIEYLTRAGKSIVLLSTNIVSLYFPLAWHPPPRP